MTREEAARLLDQTTQKEALKEAGGGWLGVHALHQALDMAIAALRAQQVPTKLDRRRWDECADCWLWRRHSFCPNCGRPLTEEAWAELEEHIDGYYISIESYDKCVDTLKAKLYDMDKEIEKLKAELERRINGGTTD